MGNNLSSCVLTSALGSRRPGCPEHSPYTHASISVGLSKAKACQAMKEDVKLQHETWCACFIRRVVRKQGSSRLAA